MLRTDFRKGFYCKRKKLGAGLRFTAKGKNLGLLRLAGLAYLFDKAVGDFFIYRAKQ